MPHLPRFPGPALGSSSPPVCPQVALVVFAIHTLVAEENAMDAEKAFVTLVVLNILNKAQGFLPFSIDSVVRVRRPGRGRGGRLGGALQGRSRQCPDSVHRHTACRGEDHGPTGQGERREGEAGDTRIALLSYKAL